LLHTYENLFGTVWYFLAQEYITAHM